MPYSPRHAPVIFYRVLYMLVLVLSSTLADNRGDSENEIQQPNNPLNPYLKSPASQLKDEVDILKLANISTKDHGVSIVNGPIAKFPAYKFRLPYGNVPLTYGDNVTEKLNSTSGFLVVFLYRQQKNNLGTLISVNSPGRLTPWFEVLTNSKLDMLSVKYRQQTSKKLKQIDWYLTKHKKSTLSSWIWVAISFEYQTGKVRFDMDCQSSRFEELGKRNLNGHIYIPKGSLLYFGQEPGRKKKFLGSIQVAKVLPYPMKDSLWYCLQISGSPHPDLRKPVI